jgi:hypothetical protein
LGGARAGAGAAASGEMAGSAEKKSGYRRRINEISIRNGEDEKKKERKKERRRKERKKERRKKKERRNAAK